MLFAQTLSSLSESFWTSELAVVVSVLLITGAFLLDKYWLKPGPKAH